LRISPRSAANVKGILDDRFVVMDKIEKGGFSKVKLCIDTETKQKYALKIFNDDKPNNLELLSQEVDTQGKFEHENIVKLHSFNFSGKLRKLKKNVPEPLMVSPRSPKEIKYVIVELGEKGALFEMLQNKGHFPAKISRTFFKQIVDGLHSLHHNNVAHRDIKLENFVVDKNYKLKMIDFGFCSEIHNSVEHITYTKAIGTESYMAPEMLFERKYFADKADVFSIGILLFCMLIGHFPFARAVRYDSSYIHFAFKRENGIKKFWENVTKECDIPQDAIDLLNKLFTANPSERITLENVMKSEFFNGETESLEGLNKFFS